MTPSDLAREPFVSLTTFRRSGAPVPTPVWVVPDGERLAVWTIGDSGKVKRVRHAPSVELRPCSRRGKVAPDAPVVTGRAELDDDPATLRRVTDALAVKYGWQYRVITLIEKFRRDPADRVAVLIST